MMMDIIYCDGWVHAKGYNKSFANERFRGKESYIIDF
jgi:hypothetical protein